MSRPESISSRIQTAGSNSAICRISLRFFSPPENPTLTPRRSMSCGMLREDRKSTRLNSSHSQISYAVFCLKKKKKTNKKSTKQNKTHKEEEDSILHLVDH